jgi:peptidoglycan hydrolase-like protein with peptidoglycan-binding domain
MSSTSREPAEALAPAAGEDAADGGWARGGATPAVEGGGRGSHRRRWLAGGTLVLVAVAIAIVVLVGSSSPGHVAGASGVPVGERTTSVTRRTLTESSTVDGTLGYGATLELYDRLAGTFTWLPAVGAVIERGDTLFKVNDLPVVLMYGDVPAYRALKLGVGDGPDVTELNENLIALGFDPYGEIDDDEDFSAATAAAVRLWQKADGLPETGEVELGRVVFAPGARRVTDVHVGLGQDPPGAEEAGGSDDPDAATDHGAQAPAAQSPDAKIAAAKSPGGRSPSSKSPGGRSPSSKSLGSRSPSSKSPGGSSEDADDDKEPEGKDSKEPEGKGDKEPEGGAGAGTLALTTTSTQQLVQLKLKAEQQQLAHVGERVQVALPGGGAVGGRVIEVGSVASESKSAEPEKGGENSGESATVPVTLAIDRRLPRLDDAPVSVELVKAIRHDVLTVPATALTATGADTYAVWVIEGRRRVALAVTPGMFANGYVQIEGAGVHEGLTVLESE